MKNTHALIFAAFLALSSSAFAWRETGHFTVCELAYQNLTKLAKSRVDAILEGKSFSESCTWPDMVRKSEEWKHTYDWHFVNIEDGQNYFTGSNMNPNGDVIGAILFSKSQLTTDFLTNAQKRPYLLFLGHFIGDIHQPLHIGKKSDLGGNKVEVTWFDAKEFDDIETLRAEQKGPCKIPLVMDKITGECLKIERKKSPNNIHKLWDLGILEAFIAEHGLRRFELEIPYHAYAKKINTATREEIKQWNNSYVLDWAQESLCLRRNGYDVGTKELGKKYYDQNILVANKRMLMGGYRLAHTLNRLFDGSVTKDNGHLTELERNLLVKMVLIRKGEAPKLTLSMERCN